MGIKTTYVLRPHLPCVLGYGQLATVTAFHITQCIWSPNCITSFVYVLGQN